MGWGFLDDIGLGFVNDVFSGAGDLVDHVVDAVKEYVIEPIKKDPWGFIVTAAAATFGIPGIIGPGAIASGITSTAVNLAQGKSFNDALKAGVTAGVTNFAIGEGMNALSDTPQPFGSSLGSVDKAPLVDSIFSDTSTQAAADTASSNFLDKTAQLDTSSSAPSGNDITSAITQDEIGAMSDGASSFGNDVVDVNTDYVPPDNIETYLTQDDQLAYLRDQRNVPYTEPVGEYFPPENSISGNELSQLPESVPNIDTKTGLDAANEYWKPQNTKVSAPAPADISGSDWWKHPIDSLGKYSQDKIGIDVTNPYIVGGALLGADYYAKKKAAEEEKRRQEQARANDPVNSPLFTSHLQQYKMDRARNRYTGDPSRYAQRNNTNQGEFGFYDPATYTPIPAATGGQIRAPYYTYGNVPPSVKEYKAGGLSALSDGRSDDIPAVLSDGEYVMDAETVALLGNGSSDAGAKQLDQMRTSLRKQKGKALSKGKFSPNARSPLAYLKKG